ncbi:hypothetical protein DFJ73DRAFT_18981 [Zopfochytrium polystomum]|nr:hypothetical protein DFJ73DRAFT_18981 [Zopfochytrium polystomum]
MYFLFASREKRWCLSLSYLARFPSFFSLFFLLLLLLLLLLPSLCGRGNRGYRRRNLWIGVVPGVFLFHPPLAFLFPVAGRSSYHFSSRSTM